MEIVNLIRKDKLDLGPVHKVEISKEDETVKLFCDVTIIVISLDELIKIWETVPYDN